METQPLLQSEGFSSDNKLRSEKRASHRNFWFKQLSSAT